MSFKSLMDVVCTDTAYISFCDIYGKFIKMDVWGRYEGYNLLRAVANWGDWIVKRAVPLDHSMEFELMKPVY